MDKVHGLGLLKKYEMFMDIKCVAKDNSTNCWRFQNLF
jgi:hypothetical protein